MINNKGISVFEIILVLAIASLIFLFSFAGYSDWRKRVQIGNNLDELRSALVRTQEQAASAANNDNWGMHLEEDRYIIFMGSFYNENDPNNMIRFLRGVKIDKPTTTFADGAGGRTSDVVFMKYTGQTSNTGTVSVIVPGFASSTREIEVQSSGIIN